MMHDYLKAILQAKKKEIADLKKIIAEQPNHSINQILSGKAKRQSTKSFYLSLQQAIVAIIAEIKRRSPSKNHLADIIDPTKLAAQYAEAGVAAISILTDATGFGGSLQDLTAVAEHLADSKIAILRKDFILDEVQIAESIVAGADAILLIVSILGEETARLLQIAEAMNIDALVEVHNAAELEYASQIGAKIIGVNNRNLTTFAVDVDISRQLIAKFPQNVIKIAESGIENPQMGAELIKLGYNGLLIGESLVKLSTPQNFIDGVKSEILSKNQTSVKRGQV